MIFSFSTFFILFLTLSLGLLQAPALVGSSNSFFVFAISETVINTSANFYGQPYGFDSLVNAFCLFLT